MAILYNLQPNPSTWAFNHQYFRFRSNLAFDPDRCVVNVNDANTSDLVVQLTLFPDPDGFFLLDTLSILKSIFNNRLHDNQLYQPVGDANEDDRLFQELEFEFEISFTDSGTIDSDTKTVNFVKGFEQPDPSLNFYVRSLDPDPGISLQALKTWPVYWWEGYPLEFAYIEEITNVIKRYIFSDGVNVSLPKFDLIQSTNTDKGFYIKWFDNRGGFSYWLFDCVYQEEIESDSTGFYQKPVVQQGIGSGVDRPLLNEQYDLDREFNYKVTIRSVFDLVQKPFVDSLLYSNEIYLYNFNKGAQIEDGVDFFRRILLGKNSVEYNIKNSQLEVEIELISNFAIDYTKILG